MNFHPILVHFPVALLVAYVILECVRFEKVRSLPYWFYVKAVILIGGALSLLPAFAAGDAIEDLFLDKTNLVETHSGFAAAVVVLFGFLAFLYTIAWLERDAHISSRISPHFQGVWIFLQRVRMFVIDTNFVLFPALAGLALITITGALGGVIGKGVNVDPIARYVYNLFF